MTAGPKDVGSTLCTTCKLCCMGVVLSGVLVRGEERDWAERRHLPLVETPLGAAFAQPCPLLDDAGCSVYEERPGPCRRFACKLLVSVQAGETTLASALAEVDSLRADVRALEESVEPAARARLWQLSALLADSSTGAQTREACAAELGPLVAPVRALRARVDAVLISAEENAAARKS